MICPGSTPILGCNALERNATRGTSKMMFPRFLLTENSVEQLFKELIFNVMILSVRKSAV